ncbi:MAG: four helix bundle protein [Chloroflexota bacterium]
MASAPIKRFEDFTAWQRARELTVAIYRLTDEGSFARDFGLRNQIRRAAVSIMSNIAEGFERGRPGEFYHFLSIAKGSNAELRSQLYVAQDVGHIDEKLFGEIWTLAEEVGRLLGGLRDSVERRRDGLPRRERPHQS